MNSARQSKTKKQGKKQEQMRVRTPPPELIQIAESVEGRSVHYFQNDNYNVDAYTRFLQSRAMAANGTREPGDHIGKASKIIDELLTKHSEAKKRLEKIKLQQIQAEEQNIRKMRFQPVLHGSSRYPIRGKMEERSESWSEQKLRNFTTCKEEKVMKEFKECTFSPKLLAKRKTEQIMRRKELRDQKRQKERASVSETLPFKQIYKEAEEKPKMRLTEVKRIIRKQINNIPF